MTRKVLKSIGLPVFIIFAFIVMGLLAPVLSGENTACFGPFAFQESGPSQEPVLCMHPLIPFGPQMIDTSLRKAVPPLYRYEGASYSQTHWLGTDKLGRDVLAGIIHGTRTALLIGFVSILLSFIVGVPLGMASAYFGDSDIQAGWPSVIVGFISLCLALFYAIFELRLATPNYIMLGLMVLLLVIANLWVSRIKSRKWKMPLDVLLVHIIGVRKSFPGIFLLLVLTSLFSRPSVWNVISIIALLGWADFARLSRAETLAVKEENYVLNVKMIGLSPWRIMWRHIFPNIWPTLGVAACFSIGGAILMEASLSFLGAGLPVEQVTWGKMLSEGRDMRAWWLVLFPGLCVFGLIWSLYRVAESLQNRQNGILRT